MAAADRPTIRAGRPRVGDGVSGPHFAPLLDGVGAERTDLLDPIERDARHATAQGPARLRAAGNNVTTLQGRAEVSTTG